MTLYIPILQARPGELTALDHVPAGGSANLMPLFEVTSSQRGTTADTYAFFKRASETLPGGIRIAVDLHGHPDASPGSLRPTGGLLEDLNAWGIPALPVIHLNDSRRRQAEWARTAMHTGLGAVIRLTSLTEPDAVRRAGATLRALRHHTGLEPQSCDVLIDLGLLASRETVGELSTRLRAVVDWTHYAEWRSVTLAGGSLPADMSRLPVGRATVLPRLESMLWGQQRRAGLGFGDYGVQSPITRRRAFARRPLPNLRYTTDDEWFVYRWPHRMETGELGMYPLCRAVAAAHLAAADSASASWGDAEILRRAANRASAGSSTDWVAWSTSHHLAQVRGWLNATPATSARIPGQRRSVDGQFLGHPDP